MPIKPRGNNDSKIAIRQIKIQGKKYKGDIIVIVELLSHVQLICDPTDGNPPGSSVHRISQARLLEWVVTSFSRESSWARDQTHISCVCYIWQADSLLLSHQQCWHGRETKLPAGRPDSTQMTFYITAIIFMPNLRSPSLERGLKFRVWVSALSPFRQHDGWEWIV